MDCKKAMQSQKVHNREDMDVDLRLDDEPNTINHKIWPTVTIREFNNYIENHEEEWIKRESYINKTGLLKKYKSIQFIDNEYRITYKVAP